MILAAAETLRSLLGEVQDFARNSQYLDGAKKVLKQVGQDEDLRQAIVNGGHACLLEAVVSFIRELDSRQP